MRILGCDISSYQGENVDFIKMEDAGAKYVILRKQIGYLGDGTFFHNLNEVVTKTHMKVGAYGALFPGYDVTRQYAKFIEGISPSDLDFPPFADIERKTGIAAIQGKSKNIAAALQYLFALKGWYGDAVPYTAKFVWESFYSSKAGWIDDWDLFVANYRNAQEPYYIPHGWEERLDGTPVAIPDSYAVWQFSADGNLRGPEFGVQSASIDLDLMHQWFWDKHIVPEPPSGDKPNVIVSYNPEKVNLIINEVI